MARGHCVALRDALGGEGHCVMLLAERVTSWLRKREREACRGSEYDAWSLRDALGREGDKLAEEEREKGWGLQRQRETVRLAGEESMARRGR